MKSIIEKVLISVLCALGVSAVILGMLKKNDPVFIVGLIFVVTGYLFIRKKLKAATKKEKK